MSLRLLRAASAIGRWLTYAIALMALAAASFWIGMALACQPVNVQMQATTQPIRFELIASSQPYYVHLTHTSEDNSVTRYRWALAAGGGVALLVAWRTPWLFRK